MLFCLLTLVSYADRVYTEIGRFLSREFQDNIATFEQRVEPRLGVGRARAALSMAVLTQIITAAIALLVGFAVFRERGWSLYEIFRPRSAWFSSSSCLTAFCPLSFFRGPRRMAGALGVLLLNTDLHRVAGDPGDGFLQSVTALTKEHADEDARNPGGSGGCAHRGGPGGRHSA